MVDYNKLAKRLKMAEGAVIVGGRHRVYRDTKGILTLGYGRNVEGAGLSEREAEYLLANDIVDRETELKRRLPFWPSLSECRQRILCEMAFQLGTEGLMGFHRFLDAVANQDWTRAKKEGEDSIWYKTDSRSRANTLLDALVADSDPS